MRQDPMAQGLKKRCPIHYEALEQNVGYIFTRRVFFPLDFLGSPIFFLLDIIIIICADCISVASLQFQSFGACCAHTHTHTHTYTHNNPKR
jgi:hypothetical protein